MQGPLGEDTEEQHASLNNVTGLWGLAVVWCDIWPRGDEHSSWGPRVSVSPPGTDRCGRDAL